MARSGAGDAEIHRITSARQPHSDDLDRRMGRYLVSMLVRTVCFLLIFVVHGPLRWVFAAAAVLLPYVAVVMANAGRVPPGPGPELGVTPRPARGLDPAAPDGPPPGGAGSAGPGGGPDDEP